MAVSSISNTVNFRGAVPGNSYLCTSEVAPIKERSKELEEKLKSMGCDEFVHRHVKAREEEIDIYSRAQFCIADFNTKHDSSFGTPEERYNYLLEKAKKYQTDKAINAFTKTKEAEYDANVDSLKSNVKSLEKQLTETKAKLQDLLQSKGATIRKETLAWLNKKVDALQNFYNESQNIAERHKEVLAELNSGDLP